ncbi:hypothetical protein F4781DRAFT_445366 [Annulohypoxylon bovei var. microspora]|nr:hypothetical protein F4781DRAFT_445366 [Annulohypoxylon bovei var. microspora]
MSATSEPQMEDDGSQDPPPTYDQVVDKTTNQSAAAIQIQPTPGPSGNGKLYGDAPGEVSINFTFMSKPGINQPWWYGRMDVKCCDVPLLMREGFYWTKANVISEEGYTNDIIPPLVISGNPYQKYTVARFWVLQDLQQPPRWTATLMVQAPNIGVVSGIRLDNWTIDMVHTVKAFDLSKKLIYHYDVSRPRLRFNSIYDGMLLKGWWPWPKEGPLATKRVQKARLTPPSQLLSSPRHSHMDPSFFQPLTPISGREILKMTKILTWRPVEVGAGGKEGRPVGGTGERDLGDGSQHFYTWNIH